MGSTTPIATTQATKGPRPASISSLLERSMASETWEPQDLPKWFPMGGATRIQKVAFLEATGFVGRDDVGVFTTLPAFTGAYLHSGSITLRLGVSVQQAADFKPAVILQFSPSDKYWYFVLPGFPAVGWQDVTVPFDVEWTDEQAVSNGWKRQAEGGGNAKSWQETLSRVYRLGVLMVGPYMSAGYKCELQIATLQLTR